MPGEPFQGLNTISIENPQGFRFAPTPGLKLANAFGVIQTAIQDALIFAVVIEMS